MERFEFETHDEFRMCVCWCGWTLDMLNVMNSEYTVSFYHIIEHRAVVGFEAVPLSQHLIHF